MSTGPLRGSRSQSRAARPTDVAGAPATEARRRGRWGGLAIVLGALTGLALCLAAAGILYLVNGSSQSGRVSPDRAAQALCADLQAQQYAAAYQLLAPPVQHEGTAQQFTLSQQQLDSISGKVTACAYTVTSADAEQASLTLSLTRARAGAVSGVVHMQYLDNAWKVDSYDSAVV